MALDDAETIKRFISQMKGQREHLSPTPLTSQPATSESEYNDSEGKGAQTPPNAAAAGQDQLTSPEPHPKPSPHISGLKAPHNTPKTAASSPRLAAVNINNEDVAEAFSDYVNNMDGRPLSDSIWAPGSARYKPSVLSGARSTTVLTPIKAVEPDPSINDTFHRMSFKAADFDHKVGGSLIGDRITQSLFSKAPPSFVNKSSVLADKVHGGKAIDVQAKPEVSSDELFEPSQKPTSSDQNHASSEITVKTETNPSYPQKISPDVTSKIADPGPVNDANPAFITMLIAQLQERGALAPEHLSFLKLVEDQLRAKASYAHAKDTQTVTGVELEREREFFESNPRQLARQMSCDSKKRAPSILPHLKACPPRVSETETPMKARTNMQPLTSSSTMDKATNTNSANFAQTLRVATNSTEHKVIGGSADAKPLSGASESEDLEHKTLFKAWPKQEERSRPAAKIRKVIIKDIPRGSTNTFVASLVYGGPIEDIHIRSSAAGDLSAMIRFMDATDCMRFYDETSNGLVYQKDSKGHEVVLFVELSKDVDVVGGLLQGWIDSGVTRCVRAVGIEAKWGMDTLLKVAERKNRKVEKIVDEENAGGARSVVFRFCKVEDAVQFKAALSRDEEWEHCNIHYAADPCASATGVHFDA